LTVGIDLHDVCIFGKTGKTRDVIETYKDLQFFSDTGLSLDMFTGRMAASMWSPNFEKSVNTDRLVPANDANALKDLRAALDGDISRLQE